MPDPVAPPAIALPPRGTLLGFDFGLARIGVAVGELETGRASPLLTVHEERNDDRFAAIAKLLDEWRPVVLVVGIPRHLDGAEHDMTARCRRFANQLRGRYGLPVAEIDERLSSAEAEARLRGTGVDKWQARKALLDAGAAQIILQHYLESLPHVPA